MGNVVLNGAEGFCVRKKKSKGGRRTLILQGHSVLAGDIEIRMTQAHSKAPVLIRAYREVSDGNFEDAGVALTESEIQAGVGDLFSGSFLVRTGVGNVLDDQPDLDAIKREFASRFRLSERRLTFWPSILPEETETWFVDD